MGKQSIIGKEKEEVFKSKGSIIWEENGGGDVGKRGHE